MTSLHHDVALHERIERGDMKNNISAADRELSVADLAYSAFVSLTGNHQIDAVSNLMRILQAGWIFLVFLLGAIYTANLATIFMTQRNYEFRIPDINTALAAKGVTMCLNQGAANEDFFRNHPDFTQVTMVSSEGACAAYHKYSRKGLL